MLVGSFAGKRGMYPSCDSEPKSAERIFFYRYTSVTFVVGIQAGDYRNFEYILPELLNLHHWTWDITASSLLTQSHYMKAKGQRGIF